MNRSFQSYETRQQAVRSAVKGTLQPGEGSSGRVLGLSSMVVGRWCVRGEVEKRGAKTNPSGGTSIFSVRAHDISCGLNCARSAQATRSRTQTRRLDMSQLHAYMKLRSFYFFLCLSSQHMSILQVMTPSRARPWSWSLSFRPPQNRPTPGRQPCRAQGYAPPA